LKIDENAAHSQLLVKVLLKQFPFVEWQLEERWPDACLMA